jgi:flagellar biosynthesis anti-sigma factor FlgM
MKIYSIDKKSLEISAESVKSSRKPAEKPTKAGTRYQDRVQLSKDALRLMELERQARVPDEEGVRAEIVERLQKRIREGTYRFESGKVAEKMLAQALQESGGE